ncbi:V-type ATP synthase subunit F [uncultured archaeon]|nr:V-type ATP synthase subunit F [uncultured archaeon]
MVQLTQQMKKMVVVGDQLMSMGLKLSGVKESYPLSKTEEPDRLLYELFERKDIGVIIASEGMIERIKDRRLRFKIENSIDPVVIEIPGYNEKEKHADTLRRLILRAVGVDLMTADKKKK